jgi:hypothetical protein
VYEKDTGELLAEVFRTHYGLVVVHRSYDPVPGNKRAPVPFARQSRGSDNLIVTPLTGDPDQRIRTMHSHSYSYGVEARDYWAWLSGTPLAPDLSGRNVAHLIFVGN